MSDRAPKPIPMFRKQPLTIVELQERNPGAYRAFLDFTEAQTMFWELSVDATGVLWAEDHGMGTRIQWVPSIGQWQ